MQELKTGCKSIQPIILSQMGKSNKNKVTLKEVYDNENTFFENTVNVISIQKKLKVK